MITKGLTPEQESIYKALNNNTLSSFQLFKSVHNIPLILDLYKTLDELRLMGLVTTYKSNNTSYHTVN